MARLILTVPGEDVDVGGDVTVVGTTSPGEVITVLRGNIALDGSFNSGGDTIRLPDIASGFAIRLLGSSAIIVGATTTINIPIGIAGLQVAFDDVVRTLRFDTTANVVKLGDQTVTNSETGVIPAGATVQILGTDGNDTVNGTDGNDVIDGLAGNDTIYGGPGDDFIRGGFGDDTIYGGPGVDQIYGGAGNDRIIDNEGAYEIIDGGAGNDHITVNNLVANSFTINGGDGDDLLELTVGTAGIAYITLGSGNDRMVVNTKGMDVSVLLGAGSDELVLPAGSLNNGTHGLTILRDFEVGATGDKVDLSGALSDLQNFTAGSNPFATGHFRLIDVFGNAYLQVDRDGAAGPASFQDLINFAAINKDTLTAANFKGLDPQAAAASQQVTTMMAMAAVEPGVTEDHGSGAMAYARAQQFDTWVDHGGYYFLA